MYAKVAAAGQLTTAAYNVDMGNGVTVEARYGFPSGVSTANIQNLFEDLSTRVIVGGAAASRTMLVDGKANCGVTYAQVTASGGRPTFTRTSPAAKAWLMPCAAGPLGVAGQEVTLPELIAVLVIAGLIAAFAASRWDSGSGVGVDELGFRERTMTALRLAQRRAQADGCEVRVTIAAGGYQLAQRATLCSGAFSLALAGTAGAGSTLEAHRRPARPLLHARDVLLRRHGRRPQHTRRGLYQRHDHVGSGTIQIVGTTGHACRI